MDNWISVKDRLLTVKNEWDAIRVIISMRNSNPLVVGCLYSEMMSFYDDEGSSYIDVTHWMPLPELPKQ